MGVSSIHGFYIFPDRHYIFNPYTLTDQFQGLSAIHTMLLQQVNMIHAFRHTHSLKHITKFYHTVETHRIHTCLHEHAKSPYNQIKIYKSFIYKVLRTRYKIKLLGHGLIDFINHTSNETI